MTSALEVTQRVYDRFAEGDLDGFMQLCAEDIEWVVNGPAALEKCQAFRGHAGVRRFLDILGASWEFHRFTPQQFLATGNTVIVLGDEEGTDKATGVGFHNRWAHVFDVEDGLVVRFREFLCHWVGNEQPPAMTWGALGSDE